ncbi:hypothetical protein PDESU_05704 [Pontiella desulfatans]|uniref:DUF192 domain-containing protein n=1 Tax=Pontiella desulfatans TaxID=2750659 RepID=A0A6C2UB08_PONDE|nr:DUF192 domain-containing protein [Pontiella desulfatans]VGO17109.1 hypothetical protein PDESU_05704 [Pontiella desulfatans]
MSRILINDGSDAILVEKLILAESTPALMRGLLGRASLPADTGMLLRPCRSIHMWFMRFPIDAAFLDQEMRVLKVARNLRPWQLAFAPRKTHCVLETASGVLETIREGNRLRLETDSD